MHTDLKLPIEQIPISLRIHIRILELLTAASSHGIRSARQNLQLQQDRSAVANGVGHPDQQTANAECRMPNASLGLVDRT
jgi:hypothetical protein